MKNLIYWLLFLAWAGIVIPLADARVYWIGPQRDTKDLRSIVSSLQPGDIVNIDPGIYREVMKIKAKGTADQPILIRGAGAQRPVFDAEGLPVSGAGSEPRSIFQIEGSYIKMEYLECKNARNGNNGAGIRLNGSTNTEIRDCFIHDCDMGIQGGDNETVLIERCDVGYNGTPTFDGYSHNFYMTGNRVVVRNCFIHDSRYGQNYKSRAHYNELWCNRILNSNEGEVGLVDGGSDTAKPDSNSLLAGNMIISKPDRTGNHIKFILFGAESGGVHNGSLFMFSNMCIASSPQIEFIRIDDAKNHADIQKNIFWGSNYILSKDNLNQLLSGQFNWIPKTAVIPVRFTESMTGTEPGFLNLGKNDFRLRSDAPFLQGISGDFAYTDGYGVKRTLSQTLLCPTPYTVPSAVTEP